MSKREEGRVDSVQRDADHPMTIWVLIRFRGSTQGFGGICLDKPTLADYERQLCDLFGVRRLEDAVGEQCFALYARDSYQERIEGLERGGRRFTLTGFVRKHWPDKAPSDNEAFLAALEEGYTDWERAPL